MWNTVSWCTVLQGFCGVSWSGINNGGAILREKIRENFSRFEFVKTPIFERFAQYLFASYRHLFFYSEHALTKSISNTIK